MPGTSIVQSGNYKLEIDAGFSVDAFILDDPLKGVLAGYTTTTTRTNLITNPNFEIDTTGWQALGTGTTITRITTDAYLGSASLQVTTGTVANSAAITVTSSGNRTPVTAGLPYYLSVWVKVPTGQPSCSLRLRTNEFQADGTQNAAQVSSTTVVSDTDGWVRLSFADTPTGGATPTVTMSFRVEITTSVARTYLIDAVLFEQSATLLPYFDGTYADTYTGYTLTSQQWNLGTNQSTSTATWGLNSSYINSQYVLNGTTQFADVTAGTMNISVRRGRKDSGDSFSAGTMTFTLNDTLANGVFNPFDQTSPYYDDNANVPGLAPLRQVNLIRYDQTGTAKYLFRGKIVDYDYSFALGGTNTVSVYCADNMYLLSQTFLNAFNPSPELSGARINTVLDLPEVAYPTGAANRDIATGTVNLGHDASYDVPAGTNALAYLTQINDTAEFGRLFVSRDGKLTFDNRIGATLDPAVATFNDTGTAIKYDNIGVSFQADQVVNRAVVTGLNGTSSIASNSTSIATYFIQNASILNSLLHDATEISVAATYLLEPYPAARYTDVSTRFNMLTTSQRDTVATIDIGNTISISKTFQTGATTSSLTQTLSVEGIEHLLDFNTGHRIRLYTSPTTQIYYLTLDDATYGVLDSDNVLG